MFLLKGDRMKKFLILMTVFMTVFAFNKNVLAETYATVKDISNKDSVLSGTGDALDVVITNNTTSKVTVEYGKTNGITLKYLDASVQGRPDNKAWLGINVPTPSDASNATFTVNGGSKQNVDKDGDYYFGITEEKLNNAAEKDQALTYTFVFTWKEGVTQTVLVKIYPKSITLQDKTGDTIWTKDDINKTDEAPKTGNTISILLVGAVFIAILSGIFNLKLKNEK